MEKMDIQAERLNTAEARQALKSVRNWDYPRKRHV